MRRHLAIVRTTALEVCSEPLAFLLTLTALGCAAVLPALHFHQFGDPSRMARDAGLSVEMDHQGKSLKAQFKAADKLGVMKTVIIGPDELAQGKVRIRDMATHNEVLADITSGKKLLGQFGGMPVDGSMPVTME